MPRLARVRPAKAHRVISRVFSPWRRKGGRCGVAASERQGSCFFSGYRPDESAPERLQRRLAQGLQHAVKKSESRASLHETRVVESEAEGEARRGTIRARSAPARMATYRRTR